MMDRSSPCHEMAARVSKLDFDARNRFVVPSQIFQCLFDLGFHAARYDHGKVLKAVGFEPLPVGLLVKSVFRRVTHYMSDPC